MVFGLFDHVVSEDGEHGEESTRAAQEAQRQVVQIASHAWGERQDGASAPTTHHPHPRPYRSTDVSIFRFSYFDEYMNT